MTDVTRISEGDLRILIQSFEAMSKGEHSIRSRQLWAVCCELQAARFDMAELVKYAKHGGLCLVGTKSSNIGEGFRKCDCGLDALLTRIGAAP